MNILVTGGLGFVGSNLLEGLIRSKDVNTIYVVDNNSINIEAFYHDMSHPKLTYVKADLTLGTQLLPLDVDCVVHLAAMGNVVDSVLDPLQNLRNNLIATVNILQYMSSNGIGRLIFSSTGGALMGNSLPPVNELSLPAPISPYGASKLACEGYIHAFSNMYSIKSTVFRFGNVYGPYSAHKKGVINKLIDCFSCRKPFSVYGDGSASRDYIYSQDIASTILKSIFDSCSSNYSVFHLATGVETSLNQLHYLFTEIFGFSVPVQYMPARVGEVHRNCADYALAESSLGFSPSLDMDHCLRETLEWFNTRTSPEKRLIP